MRRILLAVLPLACLTASAAYISPEAALRRALGDSRQRVKGAATEFRQVPLASAKSVYLFQGPDGFAVMPADDVAPALLGYGTGTVASNPEFDYFMTFLSQRVALAAEHPEWVNSFTRPQREPIAPLCQTKWNQDVPYNNECPTDNGRKCYTGCVATSTAQLMKYFNWPPQATGTGKYYLHFGQASQTETPVDLSTYTFDWDNMLNEYNKDYNYSTGEWYCTDTEAQQTAVAHLMAAVGAGVEMQYGTSGSGAYSVNVGPALVNNFGFSKSIEYLERDYYSLYVWEEMMYENLKNCGPIVYDGHNEEGGHSFICDGYAGDGLFHINWGWGGMSDGNFLLDFLDPSQQGAGGSSAGYSTGSGAVLHAKPATEQDPGTEIYIMRSGVDGLYYSPMDTQLSRYDGFSVGGGFYNYGPCCFQPNWYLSMIYEPIYDSGNAQDYTYELEEDLDVRWGWSEFGWPYDVELTEGLYRMYMATSKDGQTMWPVQIPISKPQFVIGEVDAEGKLTLRGLNILVPQVSDQVSPAEVEAEDPAIQITAQVFNQGVTEMNYTVRAELIQEGKLRAYGEEKTVVIPVAETLELDYQSTQLTVVESGAEPETETVRAAEEGEVAAVLPAGEYKLALSIKNGTAGQWIPMTSLADVAVTVKQPTGVGSIQSDKSAVWFDLQGRRVNESNLMPGIYIRKTAQGAEKIVIR